MAKVIPVGQPVNESERVAIGFLRDHLPNSWLIFHNFRIRRGDNLFEIDIAVLAPHAVYLVDVKGTRRKVISALYKLHRHAKAITKSIRDSNPDITNLHNICIYTAVLLTTDNGAMFDRAGIKNPNVTNLKHCLKYFRRHNHTKNNRLCNITPFHSCIAKVITCNAKPRKTFSALCGIQAWV